MATTNTQILANVYSSNQIKMAVIGQIFEILAVATNRCKVRELPSGGRGRRFKSSHSDQLIARSLQILATTSYL